MTTERAWTQERHEAAVARCEAATPGPWILMPELCGPEGQGVYDPESMGKICEVGDPYPRDRNHPQENMEFIAHAPTDLPDALAEIEQLRRELDTALLQLGEAQREVTRVTEATWVLGYGISFYANEFNYRERFDAYGQWTSDIQEDAGEIARNALAAAAPGGAS